MKKFVFRTTGNKNSCAEEREKQVKEGGRRMKRNTTKGHDKSKPSKGLAHRVYVVSLST